MTVLIVDDNATNRKLLSAVLRAEDINTLEAADGREAFAVLRREKVDAVISDILMPNMDGYRLCQEVRRSESFSNLPFIHYTSTYTSPADRKLSESVGADIYLAKPVSSHLLVKTLRDLTRQIGRGAVHASLPADEAVVMQEYNAALVRKLEEKNAELEKARADLCKTNEKLEERVRQRTAQLETANKELEAFSHSVAHDLQAPLRAIQGFCQALQRECANRLSREGREYLQRVGSSAQQMGRFIEDLLNLAHVNFREIVSQAVNISDMAVEISAELRRSQPARAVVFQVTPGLIARGDKVLLRAMLENLLGNAWKFTGKKKRARIEFGFEQAGETPVYFVRDDGAGFEMAYADKLFIPFQRLHNASEFPGSGVGLATVQRIVTRHGGRVWAEGKPAKGATFYFTL